MGLLKRSLIFIYGVMIGLPMVAQQSKTPTDPDFIKEIYREILENGSSYDWLKHITKEIGPRLSGSDNLDLMVDYVKKEMDQIGLDSVWLQPVMVPKWIRGEKEEAYFISEGKKTEVNVLAIGGSVSTPKNGLRSKIIEYKSIDDLIRANPKDMEGKIVFLNSRMNPSLLNTFEAYSLAVGQRTNGPGIAANKGAKGAIVRTLSLKKSKDPHTGITRYGELVGAPIPAASISTFDADLLSETLRQDPELEFFFHQTSRKIDSVQSFNIIGELKGSEFPDEYIVVGGHIDSWDVGEGAHDDGAGVVHSLEFMQTLVKLDYTPKRTIRIVGFVNEENGHRGGIEYAKEAQRRGERHIFALESDSGGFSPQGFTLDPDTPDQIVEKFEDYLRFLEPYYIYTLEKTGSGSDVKWLKDKFKKVVLSGLLTDSQRYFDIHHSRHDVLEEVNPRELKLGTAAITSLVYLIDKYGFLN